MLCLKKYKIAVDGTCEIQFLILDSCSHEICFVKIEDSLKVDLLSF